LSLARSKGAKILQKQVAQGLADLGMEKARFEVALEACALSAQGQEKTAFLLSANPGEGLKPLAKVASGGELSRVMLALKTALDKMDPVETLVFDEVDAGISGRVAEAVGRTLARLSASRQALVITHLPQVACQRAAHFEVRKTSSKQSTQVSVQRLDDRGREEAVASLVGSGAQQESALEHARAMLKAAGGRA
jgi:DNA repair protein RecN (Recombination protein N)